MNTRPNTLETRFNVASHYRLDKAALARAKAYETETGGLLFLHVELMVTFQSAILIQHFL